ncbi:hypothetical protein ACLKA6_012331 [Drosophila palustris]
MDKTVLRDLVTTNTLIMGLMTSYIVLKEAEEVQQRKRPQYWVNPYLKERKIKGRYTNAFENLTKTPRAFIENFHMSETSFEYLFSLVEPYLVPKRNLRPDAIPLKSKLAIVIELLASGGLQRHVASSYRISKQHLGRTINLVCDGICSALSGEFPRWDKQNMLKWANEYEKQWSFPNCIGAIDGKHVPIKKPPNSGSAFYNYKGFHSIVLMAVCDASYRFTFIDVGAYGSEGDMNAFSHSKRGKALMSRVLEFPENSMINGVPTPYFMVGDDAFPLDTRIMKPFGARTLTKDERIFNYRLSRARRCIENAFGILCAKWIAVQRTLLCRPDRAQKIVAACCYLHNFLLRTTPREYIPKNVETLTHTTFAELPSFRGRYNDYPKHIRNNLKEFVNSPDGSVYWQDEAAGF